MRLAELEIPEAQGQVVAKQFALAASGTQTLEGVARAAVELVQPLAQRGAAVVTLEGAGPSVHVVATSSLVDKRLAGLTLSPEAAVARAIQTGLPVVTQGDRKSTRLNSSHSQISYAVFCLKKKKRKSNRSRSSTSAT